MYKYKIRLLLLKQENKEVITLNSRNSKLSRSYEEMMNAEYRARYLGTLPENPGKLPTETASFVTTYPMMVIDTSKFFDLLSNLYDADMEKNVYEDLMLLLENSRT